MFLTKRRENYECLTRGLAEIEEITLFQSSHSGYQSSYYCQSLILKDDLQPKRYEIVNFLKEKGIGTSVYYPKPVPHLAYYKEKYGYTDESFPQAARISGGSIALPVGPHLNPEDMEYIVQCVKKAIKETC